MATIISVCWRHKRRMDSDGCWICAYEQIEADKEKAREQALVAWCLKRKETVAQ